MAMRLHRLSSPILTRMALACTSPSASPQAQPLISCDSFPEVSEYLDQIVVRISDTWLALHEAPVDETARVAFRFDQYGRIIETEVTRASSSSAEAKALQALDRASPLPNPPFDRHHCLIRRRHVLTLVAKIELNCDVPAVEDYAQEIASQVSTRLDERTSSPYPVLIEA